jgi:hypothetical protein
MTDPRDPHYESPEARHALERVVRLGARAARRAAGPATRASWRQWVAAAGAGATAAGTAIGLGGAWWLALLLGLGAFASTIGGVDLAGRSSSSTPPDDNVLGGRLP